MRSKDIAEWNKIIMKKKMKKVKKKRAKMVLKIFNFLSTLFRNKDFISQESLILTDVGNKAFWLTSHFFVLLIERAYYKIPG